MGADSLSSDIFVNVWGVETVYLIGFVSLI